MLKRIGSSLAGAMLGVLMVVGVLRAEAPMARPEQVGLSSERLQSGQDK